MTDGVVSDLVNPALEEQMVPQSKVNEVVGREKHLTEQKIRQELEERHRQELASMQGNSGGMSFEEAVAAAEQRLLERQQERELETQKQQYLEHVNHVASNYLEKMKAGPSIYEDFEAVTSDFDPKEFKELVFLAHDSPELPDIIYELSRDSDKLVRLDSLATKSPKLAKREIAKLAESIKANKMAKENALSANAPLMSLKPSSSAGIGDSGKLALRDLKKASWLKG